jgi:hypothetical protein
MDPANHKMLGLYAEFLSLYHENYPDNHLCLVGARDRPGHTFALELLHSGHVIGRLSMVRGGFDALLLEGTQALVKRGTSKNAQEWAQSYERMVKRAR